MLPIDADNGGRLAAIMPTALIALAQSRGQGTLERCLAGLGEPLQTLSAQGRNDFLAQLPPLKSAVLIVVDGLGSANLAARSGHAPTLNALSRSCINTVTPSTTAAAITTLTTGELPGRHGLVGYCIRHPQLGLVRPLRDWEGISEPAKWQLAPPLFQLAAQLGISAVAAGRPQHAAGGFTRAVLSGAAYLPGATIAERFALVAERLRRAQPTLAYLYIDELDRAGHHSGAASDAWAQRLEQLDAALREFLAALPPAVGVVLTADHGMVDVAQAQQRTIDLRNGFYKPVREVGGEPRLRNFYLHPEFAAETFAAQLREREGEQAWVATRDEVLQASFFGGAISSQVQNRLGDVLLAARGDVAYYLHDDPLSARQMVGQHGSWSAAERQVPLLSAGAFSGGDFAAALSHLALLRA